MTKKFFSLIDGKLIKKAPGKKVFPEKEFSSLVEGKELLEQVKKDAEDYRNQVAKECETLKEQAEKSGFEKGFASWSKKLAELEEEIVKVKENVEKVIVPIALQAAKKIIGDEITTDKSTILKIVKETLKPVTTHKNIIIYTHKDDLENLEKEKEKLKSFFEDLRSFSLREGEDIERGGCVIQTEGGIINARLSHRWNILEDAFEAFSQKQS